MFLLDMGGEEGLFHRLLPPCPDALDQATEEEQPRGLDLRESGDRVAVRQGGAG